MGGRLLVFTHQQKPAAGLGAEGPLAAEHSVVPYVRGDNDAVALNHAEKSLTRDDA